MDITMKKITTIGTTITIKLIGVVLMYLLKIGNMVIGKLGVACHGLRF